MSIKRYDEYQNTSVSWVNKIPRHWELLPTKRAFRRKKETNAGMKVENRLALTMKGVLKRSLDDLDGLQASEYETYQIFQKGDLAFKLIDLQNIKTSRVGIVPEEGIMSPAYIRLEGTGKIEPKYGYWYFMKLYHECIFNELGGGVRQTIGPEELLSLPLTYPPKAEQHSIVTFLDRETAKIDALIAEQQRLIELLQQKRQAVISQAVTKGLNPNAPMKDSGVEWLGEVPEHWETGKIKHYFRTTSGSTPNSDKPELYYTTEEDEEGTPWIRTTDIDDGEVKAAAVFITPKALGDTACKPLPVNTVLVALYGGGGTVGKNGILKIEAAVNQALCGILPSPKALPEYVHRYIQFLRPFWMERAVSARKAGNISQELVGDTIFPMPSLEEQTAILRSLEEKLEELDELAGQSSASLGLLEERRTALISAAVTGQIDVRGLIEVEAGEQ